MRITTEIFSDGAIDLKNPEAILKGTTKISQGISQKTLEVNQEKP